MSTVPLTVETFVAMVGSVLPTEWSLADVQQHLGGVPLERIRSYPPPGLATEESLLVANEKSPLCELVDGVLVEKAMGAFESIVTMLLVADLQAFLKQNPVGFLTGPDGPLRLTPRKVRLPDISLFRWERYPSRKIPRKAALVGAPDLAVEVLSPGNTDREIARKLEEYFSSGTTLAWIISPESRTASIYSTPTNFVVIDAEGWIEGGEVLPGFAVRLGELLDRVEREDA